VIGQQLQRAAQALQSAMQRVSGASVTYTRGNLSATIDAVRARSTFVTDDQAPGMQVQASSQDFIIEVAALVLGDVYTRPQAGDRISLQIDQPVIGSNSCQLVTQIFEVIDPPYSPADSVGQRYRVHTKQVS